MVTLWNDKSYHLTNDCLPVRAWLRQPIQQLNKVSEGRRPEHLLNTPKDSTQPTIASNYIYGVISQKYATDHFEIQQTIKRWTVHDRRARVPTQVHMYSMKQQGCYHCDVTVVAFQTKQCP